MNDVEYEVFVRKIITYHGTLSVKVPGGKISPEFEEGYARGATEMAITSGQFDEKQVDWEDKYEIEYEVVDAGLMDSPPLADISPPVDAEVIPVDTPFGDEIPPKRKR